VPRNPSGDARVSQPPRVTYLVKRLELAIRAEMDVIVGAFGVTALQYTALSVLDRHPGMSGAQLARRSFVSAQAGSEMIGVLERKGLIERTPHERNRRVLCISLTGPGRELLAACDTATDALEVRMLEGLSGRERDRLRSTLETCVASLAPVERSLTRVARRPGAADGTGPRTRRGQGVADGRVRKASGTGPRPGR
jgi:DNA-binding MarR family transcriptional regulator